MLISDKEYLELFESATSNEKKVFNKPYGN